MRIRNVFTTFCFLLAIVFMSVSLPSKAMAAEQEHKVYFYFYGEWGGFSTLGPWDVAWDGDGNPMVSLDAFLKSIPSFSGEYGPYKLDKFSVTPSEVSDGLKDKLAALTGQGNNILGVSDGDKTLSIFGRVYELESPVRYLTKNKSAELYVPLTWCLSLFDGLYVEAEEYEKDTPKPHTTASAHTIYRFYGRLDDYEYIMEWLFDYAVPVKNTEKTNTDLYAEFLEQFTLDLVADASTDMEKLEIVYDFILDNFCYVGQRDGAAIDGSRRPDPNQIPQPDGVMGLGDGAFAFALGDNFYLRYSWELLYTGEGSCTQFSALFGSMAEILGFNIWYAGGDYINSNGSRVGHEWTAIKLDGIWYFFDPQIETSNVTKSPGTTNRRIWWMQNVHDEVTQSRYDTDFAGYGVGEKQTRTVQFWDGESGHRFGVIVNGKNVEFKEHYPVMKDGQILAPVQGVFERMGFTVDWDDNTSTATLTRGNETVVVPVRNASFTVNGATITPDVPAQMINGHPMLPLRAICESIGGKVTWNAVEGYAFIECKIPKIEVPLPRMVQGAASASNLETTGTTSVPATNTTNTHSTNIETTDGVFTIVSDTEFFRSCGIFLDGKKISAYKATRDYGMEFETNSDNSINVTYKGVTYYVAPGESITIYK